MTKLHVILIVASVFAASLPACTTGSTTSGSGAGTAVATPDLKSAWTTCTQSVQSQEGISTSEAPDYSSSNVSKLPGGKFAAILYYSGNATFYRCALKQGSDGAWQVEDLKSLQPSEITIFGSVKK